MNPVLLLRYRVALFLFVGGLVFSGLTAFPLLTELRLLTGWLGIESEHWADYSGLSPIARTDGGRGVHFE